MEVADGEEANVPDVQAVCPGMPCVTFPAVSIVGLTLVGRLLVAAGLVWHSGVALNPCVAFLGQCHENLTVEAA